MNPTFLVIAIVIIPVLSVCLGFTVHYAIRPLIESLLDAIHDLGRLASGGGSDSDVIRLQAEVDDLRQEVLRLKAPAAFDAELTAAATTEGRLPPGSALYDAD